MFYKFLRYFSKPINKGDTLPGAFGVADLANIDTGDDKVYMAYMWRPVWELNRFVWGLQYWQLPTVREERVGQKAITAMCEDKHEIL